MNHVNALYLRGSEPIKPNDGGSLTRNLKLGTYQLEPRADLAWVKVKSVGVCGSDVSAALGKQNFNFVRRDLTPDGVIDGHEGGGYFAGVGPELLPYKTLQPGDRVVAVAMRGCGACRGCICGRPNRCRKKKILGFHQHGLMSGVCLTEPDRLLPVLPSLTDIQVACIEPLSVVQNLMERLLRALERGTVANLDVVVSGPGIIGFMAAETLRSMGARVAICGVEQDQEHRLSIAQARGIHPIVIGGTHGTLQEQLAAGIRHCVDGNRIGDPHEDGCVDVYIECSGAPSALTAAPKVTANAGTIAIVATYGSEVDGFPATIQVRAEQTMVTTMGSAAGHYLQAMLALERHHFDPTPYVKVYPAAQALDAFEAAMTQTVCKPVIDWTVPA